MARGLFFALLVIFVVAAFGYFLVVTHDAPPVPQKSSGYATPEACKVATGRLCTQDWRLQWVPSDHKINK